MMLGLLVFGGMRLGEIRLGDVNLGDYCDLGVGFWWYLGGGEKGGDWWYGDMVLIMDGFGDGCWGFEVLEWIVDILLILDMMWLNENEVWGFFCFDCGFLFGVIDIWWDCLVFG